MTLTAHDAAPATPEDVLDLIAQGLGSTPAEVTSMLEAIERGESRADYFGFTDDVLRSIEAIALAYYRGQRYQDAQVVFGMVVLLTDGAWGSAFRGLGACAQAQNEWSVAAEQFRRALAQNADDAHSAVYLGECLCLSGQINEGLQVLEAALQRGKDNRADAPLMQRARAIVQTGGNIQAPKAKGNKPAAKGGPRPEAPRAGSAQGPSHDELLEAKIHEAADNIVNGLTTPTKVEDPEIQALLDNPETRAQLEEIAQAVRTGALTLRQVADFSPEQMDAGYAIASQMLERGETIKALQFTGYMLYLDSRDTRFHRLAGLCMHHLKLYPLADYYYTLVGIWRQGGADPATLIYHGEIKLMLDEHEAGRAMLKKGLTEAANDRALREVVKRGAMLLKQAEQSPG